jgi:S1-C subfamily serine protease
MRSTLLSIALSILGVVLSFPAPALGAKISTERFYRQTTAKVATLEFTQEFVAGGQPQQTRSFTDAVVISKEGLVLVSGKIRFPQRGHRLSGGSLPELGSLILHFADGRRHQAKIVAFDDDLNLGLLRITDTEPGTTFPHAKLRAPGKARIGQGVRIMTLYTEEYGRNPVFMSAMIDSLLKSPQDVWSLSGVNANLLGAALWNGSGEMIGVVAQVPMSPSAGRQVVPNLSGPVGLSYARFRQFIEDSRASHRGDSNTKETASSPANNEQGGAAWLGIMFQPLGRELSEHLQISEGGGIVLSRVIPGSPAAEAGLKALDILVEMEGERISVRDQSDTPLFAQQVRMLKPGTVVSFTRERPGGERTKLALTLIDSPLSELHAQRSNNELFELRVRELTLDTLLSQRMEPGETGVVVDGVTRAGWAGLAGLSQGQIIQRINERAVTDIASFQEAMQAIESLRPDKVLFFTRYLRSTRFLVAEPTWDEVEADQ